MRVLKQSDSRLLSVIEHDLGFLKRRVVRQQEGLSGFAVAVGLFCGVCACLRRKEKKKERWGTEKRMLIYWTTDVSGSMLTTSSGHLEFLWLG